MNGQSEKMKSMRKRPPKHRLHYNCVNDVAAYREDLRRQYKRINPAKEDGDERWEPMLRSLDPFVVYLKEAMRDSETGSQRALTPQHKQQEERLRCPTLSLVALPNEGDILTSTQVLGMGRGMDDKNKIAELASRGFKIHPGKSGHTGRGLWLCAGEPVAGTNLRRHKKPALQKQSAGWMNKLHLSLIPSSSR